jgi:protein-tyrosine phosphatase
MSNTTTYKIKSLPIMIDNIRIPGINGMIGISSCPGLRDDYVFDLYSESLVDDVQAIKGWGAAVVITLMDENELQRLGVRDLGKTIVNLNMIWLHLPLHNLGLPDERFNEKWQMVKPCLCNLLREGQRVLIHCREGIGRAALTAARLLLDLGFSPEESISMVRRARPGSLLLHSQEKYIYSVSEASTENQNSHNNALNAMQ